MTDRVTVVQAVADLAKVASAVTQDGTTFNDQAPNPNSYPAGPSLYISPVAQETADHQNWQLTLEFSVSYELPGTKDSQAILWRVIDAVEAAFDGPNDLGTGLETTWQSGVRTDLRCLVCSWTVTMPKENL